MAQLDLVELIRDSLATWHQMSQQKWKIHLSATLPEQPVWIHGDSSHLQQAIENLIFNARDATFEMRSHLRESARSDNTLSADDRRQRLIEAASWRGNVELSVTAHPPRLIVADNGIGMTPEVRDNCMATHFSTKRDNAIFEGYNAGMGLGLSFVAVVLLGHHNATSTIETEPWKGTRFIITFPNAA